jgi:hypothetical protein
LPKVADEGVVIGTEKRKSPGPRASDRGKVGIRTRKPRAICAFGNSQTVRFRYREGPSSRRLRPNSA